jgi:hypothetical protein
MPTAGLTCSMNSKNHTKSKTDNLQRINSCVPKKSQPDISTPFEVHGKKIPIDDSGQPTHPKTTHIRYFSSMKKRLTLLMVLFSMQAFAQVDREIILRQAETCANALIEEDYETVVKFTYPKVIELAGGSDKLIAIIKNGKEEMRKQGIKFDEVSFGQPSEVVKAGNELHVLVPQTVVMRLANGRLKNDTHLLGISQDGGANWFFIDTANLTMETIKDVLPHYNSKLVPPRKGRPIFIAD